MSISFNNSYINKIDFTYLKYFFAVASYGGYSKASRAIGVAQPTLSIGVKKLEEELSINLIERDSKNFALTPEGIALLDSCWNIDSVFGNFIKKAGNNHLTINRRLRIGAGFSVGTALLKKICIKSNEKNELIDLEIINESAYQLLSSLKEGKIDAAIIPDEVSDSLLSFKTVLNDHVTFVVSKKLAKKFTRDFQLSDLEKITLVNYPRETQMNFLINKLIVNNKLKFKSEVTLTNFEIILSFVKSDIGGAFMMKAAVQDEIDSGELVELDLSFKMPKRGFLLATRQDQSGEEIANLLFKYLK